MARRYYVDQCDNGNTLDSGRRITWAVMRRGGVSGDRCVADFDTRAAARRYAATLNAEAERLRAALGGMIAGSR